MNIWLQLPIISLAGLFIDWIFCERLGALAPTVGYKYRPTVVRYGGIFILAIWLVYFNRVNDTSHPWIGGIIITGALLCVYGSIAVRDVLAQRNRGDGSD